MLFYRVLDFEWNGSSGVDLLEKFDFLSIELEGLFKNVCLINKKKGVKEMFYLRVSFFEESLNS